MGGVAMAGLAAGCSSPAAQQAKPRPFTPEVDEFVAIYLKTGGDKLTDWVQGEAASRPDEALRAFKTERRPDHGTGRIGAGHPPAD